MKRETLQERKRFAAELAARDAAEGIGPPLALTFRSSNPSPKARAMRQWWLDRHTPEELRELGEGLEL